MPLEVYFLIVGHTHCSIDQYFSVTSRDIGKCDFIGSPLALVALMSQESRGRTAKGEEKIRKHAPLLVRKISVIFDMVSVLNPLINPKIKYYPIPHKFVFEKWAGIATMQYSVFSDSPTLLPLRPIIVEDFNFEASLDISINLFQAVGGLAEFVAFCGAKTDKNEPLFSAMLNQLINII